MTILLRLSATSLSRMHSVYEHVAALCHFCGFLLGRLIILVSVVAFNVGGGFTRPSGGYIFFFATLFLSSGLSGKLSSGNLPTPNLHNPLPAIGAYCGCIATTLLPAPLSTKLKTETRPSADGYRRQQPDSWLTLSLELCFVIAPLLPGGNGSFISAINQVNRFFPMAIILGLFYMIPAQWRNP